VLEKFIHLDENKKTALTRMGKGEITFLLQLSGGDKRMAKRILEEIKNEIPRTISKLRQVQEEKKYDMLDSVYHDMLSTFAPMGNETAIMLKLEQLRNGQQFISNKEFHEISIDELVREVKTFDNMIENTIETIG
jgi:Holliday junction resolvasome RuvABC DNA-binding subunit